MNTVNILNGFIVCIHDINTYSIDFSIDPINRHLERRIKISGIERSKYIYALCDGKTPIDDNNSTHYIGTCYKCKLYIPEGIAISKANMNEKRIISRLLIDGDNGVVKCEILGIDPFNRLIISIITSQGILSHIIHQHQ